MKRLVVCVLFAVLFAPAAFTKTLTYNSCETVNLNDLGLPADERSTHVLAASGDIVFGATSGFKCHVYRFEPKTKRLTVLATVEGPNTVLKGFALHGDTIYFGTMLTRRQLWWVGRKRGGTFDIEDANLYPIDDTWNTGRLYKITGINGSAPKLHDLGVPVKGQGIHTLALDHGRGLLYGLTCPAGRFFIYDTKDGNVEEVTFGTTYSHVSNHMVSNVEVVKDLTDFTPGDVEFNNKLVSLAMHVLPDGTMYTSGRDGQILKYDPSIKNPQSRFSSLGYIPSVPGRQHWNRIDEIVGHDGMLYAGTSDGYIVRLSPETGDMETFGKPIRAVEVRGMAFSPLDGRLYGANGGDLEGMSRFWCLDTDKGTYEVDYPAIEVFRNRRPVGDIVCTDDGTIVISETMRVANLYVLTPGEPKQWEKSGVLGDINPEGANRDIETRDLFAGHKKLEVDIYPIPSTMHGGSGYTAIQADENGRIYVGGAYYGKFSPLMQLDPETARWRLLFRSDDLTHQYGRGQGIPGKIHTKLRLGSDGRIYGAMKQGYEMHYGIRSDVGESPEGMLGGQFTCHFFNYDPATDTVTDMGPGWPQEGITIFHVDIDRGYVYGMTVPGVFFLVYDLKTGRVWNAGPIAGTSPSRYMALDYDTGRVYHRGEATPGGKYFMTVWDPDEFRLRDIEIAAEDGLRYTHSYAVCCGPVGSNTLYGSADGKLCEMNLNIASDGMLHVRPVCTQGLDGETVTGRIYSIACGPDNRIYWGYNYGDHGPYPISVFAWNPGAATKTYLGTCALEGEWCLGGHNQGICLDNKGNLALHILYAGISDSQKKHWKVSDDFYYKDIEEQPYYLGYPGHYPGTYYSVFYLKNAVSIR